MDPDYLKGSLSSNSDLVIKLQEPSKFMKALFIQKIRLTLTP